ncbi:NUDIX domain-containing protein [Streptosporangium sp. NPDC051023]|uniref:NUDIX hydrolase n=1 Tax=Streptosporangium sp. NPDC051023 TaxID=3155410 RepID=UPI00344E21A2
MAICDNLSVGLVIERDGAFLGFNRNTPPVGFAFPAGHVLDHGTDAPTDPRQLLALVEKAAREEAKEEVGLTVVSLEPVISGLWQDNACRRAPGPKGVGHRCFVYRATVTGEPTPSPRETRDLRWVTRADLQDLANRTADHAEGLITPEKFAADPGAEPVWIPLMVKLGLILMSPGDRDRIAALARQAPARL